MLLKIPAPPRRQILPEPRPTIRLDPLSPLALWGRAGGATPRSLLHLQESRSLLQRSPPTDRGVGSSNAGVRAGLDIDRFVPRISFFFNAHNDFFEEVAKYRAARRIWARSIYPVGMI